MMQVKGLQRDMAVAANDQQNCQTQTTVKWFSLMFLTIDPAMLRGAGLSMPEIWLQSAASDSQVASTATFGSTEIIAVEGMCAALGEVQAERPVWEASSLQSATWLAWRVTLVDKFP